MRHLSKKQKLELSKMTGVKTYSPVFKKRGSKLPTAKAIKAQNKKVTAFKTSRELEKKKALQTFHQSQKPKLNVSLNPEQQNAVELLEKTNKNVLGSHDA
jgi:hypothetical protein